MVIPDERGQVYTLEGIVAALIVMAGLLFALQATTASPATGGISNPQAQQQDGSIARDLLMVADDEDLRQAVLYWDGSGDGSFHCTPGTAYYPAPGTAERSDSGGCPDVGEDGEPRGNWVPPTPFGSLLEQYFGPGYSYNVYVAYNDSGDIARQRMVYQGQPGDGVVRASTSVTLMDDDELYDAAGDKSGTTLASASNFYAPDESSGDDFYNVAHLEVVVWRG